MAENGSISNEIYNMSELREEKVKMEEPAKISGHTPQSQDFTSKVLDFLSKASNEKLGACAVGLGIATYFILGRLGLILIGVVGGVILHSTREESNAKSATSLGIETKRRKETSLEVVGRLLTWQDMRLKSDTFDSEDETTKELTIDEFRPETATALNHLVDRVIEDYVKWWYSPILSSDLSFPQSCRKTLTSFLVLFSNHLSKKRPEDMFLNFLTNSISIFIVFLSELSNALMASAAIGKEPVDAITLYLTDHPDSSFANVLDKSEQRRKLKAVSEDMLKTFLEPKAYQFDPVRIFLTQALADLILEPTLVTCSKAEWINGWIVYLLEQGEPELMNVINAGVGEATSKPGSTVVTKQGTQKNSHTIVSESDDEDREALREVKRLNALIAAEQSKQSEEPAEIHEQSKVFKNSDEVASSAPSIDNLLTPTSSQSDLAGSRSYTSLDEQSRTDQDNEEPDEMAVTEAIPITSFDQILPQEQLFSEPIKSIPLTLHKAVVSIFDDSQPSDKSAIRTKPSVDYLLQIEPASSQHPGWMIARKYADFETLHEVLRRISVISGVPEFGNRYPNSPTWRGQTKNTFRINLEKYLREALSHSRLAESEGMKRFLEKDQGLEKLGSSSKGVLGFPSPEAFQTMGKGMLDVLASAPKGAVGGGKVLLDGMKGVGGVFTGQKRSSRPSQDLRTTALQKKSEEGDSSYAELTSQDTEINDDSLLASRVSADSFKPQPLPVLSSLSTDTFEQITTGSISSNRVSFQDTIGLAPDAIQQAAKKEDEYERLLNLPPRPDEMDDKEGTVGSAKPPLPVRESRSIGLRESIIEEQTMSNSNEAFSISSPAIQQVQKLNTPLTTEETSIAIELIFATISSLYTLSSVWSIRKALLNAAKTFLIRPGNPNLTKIQTLIQETIIDANVSDTGIAYHLQKLRENSLPTTEEYATWPAPSSTAAKEKLRSKARRLLVEQGLPPALRGIMGAAASGEALGRLFDSLQEEDVARGLIFAVLVQGIRALAH